jgi:hypothetical protein
MAAGVAAVQAARSLERACAVLATLPGCGDFGAYEVAIDYCESGLLAHSLDSWAFIGNGAVEGLALLGLPPTQASLRALRDHQHEGFAHAGVAFYGPVLND